MGVSRSSLRPAGLVLEDFGNYASALLPQSAQTGARWGLRLVCVSDTHGHHRQLAIPEGDVLIHGGDFTAYGREAHARDFDAWLSELPHATKIVVVGNHENNSDWNQRAAEILKHATLLRQSSFCIGDGGPRVFGTDFFWPCPSGNPNFDEIPEDTDLLVAHGPAKGCVDGDMGCPSLLAAVRRVRPAVVVSGHIHAARGAATLDHGDGRKTLLVNAASCGSGKQERMIANVPIVIDI